MPLCTDIPYRFLKTDLQKSSAFAVSAPARASRSMDCRVYAGWTGGTVSLHGYGSGALSFKTRFGMVHTDLLPMYGEPDNVSALDFIMN